MHVLSILFVTVFWTRLSTSEDRLLIDARVNDQTVLLAFDTGAEDTLLFRQAAKRLNLNVTKPRSIVNPGPGKVPLGMSEECQLAIGKHTSRFRFPVFELPEYLGIGVDGVLAWADMKNEIIQIDASAQRVILLACLPDNISQWTRWTLDQDSRYLVISLPKTSQPAGTVLIDTGSSYGVELCEKGWEDWCSENMHSPSTLVASYSPSVGIGVYRESWAAKLNVGQLSITNVPVMESLPDKRSVFENYQATLGLFALTRLNIIVDGKNSVLYTRPMPKPKSKYHYNRAAAVFVPRSTTNDDLVAYVLEGGPAHEAGIRTGDVLLKIDDLDVTEWRTNPKVLPLARFWARPAGTRLNLSLLRNGRPLKVTVELKELFPPVNAD